MASCKEPRGGLRNTPPWREDFEPLIVAFCCNWCSYAAADLAGTSRLRYPPNVRIIRVPCTGKVDPLYVLKTFESNADGVFVAGCLEGGCHYSTGNLYAKKRILRLKKMLDAVGVGGERLEFYNLSAAMAEKFVEVCEEMVARIKKLGPLPWRCTR